MSDVSGIPYMGPMGVGNLFAPLYPALSGGGNMSAGQISAPYAGPSAYNQNVLANLYSSGGGFGAQTDYYSQLAANQLSALTPTTFAQAPSYNYGSLYGGGEAATPPSAYDYGGGLGGGGIGGLGGGGGFSGYDYGSLYGGGGAAAPPSSFGYGSLYNPPAAPDPLSYQTLYSGSGGLFQGGFPNAGGYQTPSAQKLLGYDPNAADLSGGASAYNYGSLYGGGGGSITDRLIQTMGGGGGWGNAPGAMPDMQRLLGYNPPSQYDFPAPPVQPQPMGYDYGSLYGGGGAATSPSSYGYGSLGGGGGGIYDPFNVGGRLDPALYGPGGLGGGGGIGQAPAAMPDLQRLLGYNPRQLSALPDRSGIDFRTPDVQGGIDSLQQTLDLIDRTTGGGYTLSPQDRDIPFRGPGDGSTLSPQDRQIQFGGGGFRDPSFFAPGGIGDGGSSYTDPGLPLEITQGGSTPGGALFSDFNRSLFGDAPAYPSGVVRGPYALPDVGGGGPASAPAAARGGALPFFGGPPGGLGQPMAPRSPQPYFDEPAAGYGGASMPQQQQYFDEPAAGFGGLTTGRYDSPDVFGGYEGQVGPNRRMPGEMTYSPALDATFVKPEYRTADVFRALQDTAANSGFRDESGLVRPDVMSPSALAMMIQGETKWNPNDTSPGGKYRGLTQIGPENEFYSFTGPDGPFGVADLTPAQQIRAYFDWLNHPEHNVPNTTRNAGLSLAGMSPIEQAAYLQGTQFSPNPLDWRQQLAGGNIDYRFARGQAPEMQTPPTKAGDVTMRSLQDYYQQMNANPPWMPQTAPWAGIY